jgi:hypothetical protein
MYWFASPPGWGLILWLVSMLLVLVGGWLISTHVFALEPGERVLAGFAIGLVSYLWLVNWIGRVLPPFWTFLGGAAMVLLAGAASAHASRKPWLNPADLRIGPWLAAGFALFWTFLRVSKGTGMFDEYKNLAIISTLGNGGIPGMAYFGQPLLLRYHYGFHLLGAGMMQLAHLTPWSAFDLSKSMIWSLSLLLAGLVGSRYLRTHYAPALLAGAVALAGGSRYLLLLLPSRVLAVMQAHVAPMGIASGALSSALASILPLEGSPGIGIPFAFLSGINQSYVMAHGGSSTMEPMLLMLGILLLRRASSRLAIVFFIVLFSFWALTSETSFILFASGTLVLVLTAYYRNRKTLGQGQSFAAPALGLLLSIPVVLVQGGVITSIAQRLLIGTSTTSASASAASESFAGFSLRWPPAIISGQLGSLPLTDPWALLAGILEMGIVVIMLPWLTWHWWRWHRDDWVLQLLLPIAWVGVLTPMFLAWVSDANVAHISDFGIDVAVVILVLALARGVQPVQGGGPGGLKLAGAIVLALMMFPGAVVLGVELTAAQTTVYSEHYGDAEARLLQNAWGRLPRGSKVLGLPGPGSILTGELTAGIYNLPPGNERPVWEAMIAAPRLATLLENDFEFVFVDSRWWNSLDSPSRQELEQPCITVFARGEAFPGGNKAEILDLRGCR